MSVNALLSASALEGIVCDHIEWQTYINHVATAPRHTLGNWFAIQFRETVTRLIQMRYLLLNFTYISTLVKNLRKFAASV